MFEFQTQTSKWLLMTYILDHTNTIMPMEHLTFTMCKTELMGHFFFKSYLIEIKG